MERNGESAETICGDLRLGLDPLETPRPTVSTLAPDQLEEIALTVDLGKRLTLIVVFGPGYLAEEGLAEIREVIGADRRVVQHRLDRLGPNVAETLDRAETSHLVVLVSGLERVAVEQREHVLERRSV